MPLSTARSTTTPRFLSFGSTVALAVAIVLIVVVPFGIARWAMDDSEDTSALVSHTREVESALFSIASDARNLEAAALTLTKGIDAPALRVRIAEAQARVRPTMDRLFALTADNTRQQVRLGALRENLTARLAGVEVVIGKGERATVEDIDTMIVRYPIQRLVDELVAEEQALLQRRVVESESASVRANILVLLAMLAQLALLGWVTWFTVRQLAQRVSAQRSEQGANARSAAVLDTVREPIVLLDRAQHVVMHNAAFGDLYGLDDEGDARGRPLADIGNGAWKNEATLRRLQDVLARGRELWDYQQSQVTADGVERVMLLNARPMPLPDSEDEVVLVTASDITVQSTSERQIRDLNRQLEGKVEQVSDVNRELEAFSYSVSHDLRAPLRHIAGFADKLGRQLGDAADDKSRHYLEVIGSSAKRMSTLIDDLLVYSRLGRSAVRQQMVDLQSLVSDTRAMLDSNAAQDYPGHVVEWRIAPMPVVVGDENMLRQVWLNLLGNAVKYSAKSEPARIEVGYRQSEDGAHEFSVRDNGAGFDMAYAGKLFGVFQRLHSASEFPGTGIGLASVRRVLSRHGGQIRAESAPGEGATFHFTLPVQGDATKTNRTTDA